MRDHAQRNILALSQFGNDTLVAKIIFAALVAGWCSNAIARPYGPEEFTSAATLKRLRTKVGAVSVPVQDFCRTTLEEPCIGKAMDHFRGRLQQLSASKTGKVRVLQLGDSHIASDFISSFARHLLQKRFGDAGRGLVHADQPWGYGGRRLRRRTQDWRRTRVVDAKGPDKPYGLFGVALKARRKRARIDYRLLDGDAVVEIHYAAGPKLKGFQVFSGGKAIAKLNAKAPTAQTRVRRLKLSKGVEGNKKRLRLVALGKGATVYGLSFERMAPGLIWSSIGPVGADARVYLQLERSSFAASLKAHAPDLVILMVGGNDALKVRKKWKKLSTVINDHRKLVTLLRAILPNVDILMMSPMDAGRRRGRKVMSKTLLPEVREEQLKIAQELGLGFWDTYQAMGGKGAIARWVAAGVMSKDLVHPRKSAADLLGQLLGDALMKWFSRNPS